MTKAIFQKTFDFFTEPEEKQVDENNQQPAKENNYATPKPPLSVQQNDPLPQPVNTVAEIPQPQKKTSTRGRRSLKDMVFDEDRINIPDDETLFKKQYYAIGEVAVMFDVNPSLLRYWETEFDMLQPRKNRKGDRFFRPQDIKIFCLIFDLLRRRKFTIEGAKDYLKKNKGVEEKYELIQSLEKIKSFLLELKAQL